MAQVVERANKDHYPTMYQSNQAVMLEGLHSVTLEVWILLKRRAPRLDHLLIGQRNVSHKILGDGVVAVRVVLFGIRLLWCFWHGWPESHCVRLVARIQSMDVM